MRSFTIRIQPGSAASFTNNAAFCVGTGRMGLALQREYMDQLALAQTTSKTAAGASTTPAHRGIPKTPSR